MYSGNYSTKSRVRFHSSCSCTCSLSVQYNNISHTHTHIRHQSNDSPVELLFSHHPCGMQYNNIYMMFFLCEMITHNTYLQCIGGEWTPPMLESSSSHPVQSPSAPFGGPDKEKQSIELNTHKIQQTDCRHSPDGQPTGEGAPTFIHDTSSDYYHQSARSVISISVMAKPLVRPLSRPPHTAVSPSLFPRLLAAAQHQSKEA